MSDMTVQDVGQLRSIADRWGNNMRVRLEHGARKFGVMWRDYPDEDVRANLHRAVADLEAALVNLRKADEMQEQDGKVYAHLLSDLPYRAADVANQAFMLADVFTRDPGGRPVSGPRSPEPRTNPWTWLHENDFSWDDVNAIAAILGERGFVIVDEDRASSSDELRAALLGAEEALRRLVSDGWSAASERQAIGEADSIRAALHTSQLDADKDADKEGEG